MRGQFIVTFIPGHVSNGVMLKAYRMLSLFGVPRFVRKKHYREEADLSAWYSLSESCYYVRICGEETIDFFERDMIKF